MVTVPRPKSPVAAEPAMGRTTVLFSVKLMQLGPVRQAGSQGLWQQGAMVGRVMGVVPSVGAMTGVVGVDMVVLFLGYSAAGRTLVSELGGVGVGFDPSLFEAREWLGLRSNWVPSWVEDLRSPCRVDIRELEGPGVSFSGGFTGIHPEIGWILHEAEWEAVSRDFGPRLALPGHFDSK